MCVCACVHACTQVAALFPQIQGNNRNRTNDRIRPFVSIGYRQVSIIERAIIHINIIDYRQDRGGGIVRSHLSFFVANKRIPRNYMANFLNHLSFFLFLSSNSSLLPYPTPLRSRRMHSSSSSSSHNVPLFSTRKYSTYFPIFRSARRISFSRTIKNLLVINIYEGLIR